MEENPEGKRGTIKEGNRRRKEEARDKRKNIGKQSKEREKEA